MVFALFIQHYNTFQIYDKLYQTNHAQPAREVERFNEMQDTGTVVGQSTAEGRIQELENQT